MDLPPIIDRDLIALPAGWTWEQTNRTHPRDGFIPVATAPGVVAWGTIGFEVKRILDPDTRRRLGL